ncbi:MAG: DUF1707 domain-containing protein [Streptosporangiaceae bacterium]|nr:DUF1707 domain-containing protein [Streptosporangiaceae bacterium]MBV9855820.1 DUF1707 domain-containing protein [Streptosporangiaceae bacterium]
MNDASTQHDGLAIRASDAEREQTVALLQRNFADARLTQAELEERASAAYTAQTRAQLRDLTADLPAVQQQPPRTGMVVDPLLLYILLCVCPPAALAYWLLSLRDQPATAGSRQCDSLPAELAINGGPEAQW